MASLPWGGVDFVPIPRLILVLRRYRLLELRTRFSAESSSAGHFWRYFFILKPFIRRIGLSLERIEWQE